MNSTYPKCEHLFLSTVPVGTRPVGEAGQHQALGEASPGLRLPRPTAGCVHQQDRGPLRCLSKVDCVQDQRPRGVLPPPDHDPKPAQGIAGKLRPKHLRPHVSEVDLVQDHQVRQEFLGLHLPLCHPLRWHCLARDCRRNSSWDLRDGLQKATRRCTKGENLLRFP